MPRIKAMGDAFPSNSSGSPDWFYSPLFGMEMAVPQWEAIAIIVSLALIIVLTVAGNIFVIISVVSHAALKITPNFFIVSLAAADIAVSTLVLPLNLIYNVVGRWVFGPVVCKMWLTSDVLCCTASILNLCAIAVDRYFALCDPVGHAHRRTVRFVLLVILAVWLVSFLISCPPLLGWNDWPDQADWTTHTPCRLTEERGYVVYSSMGSFFIPMVLIIFTYLNIFLGTRQRLRKRTRSDTNNLMPTARNVSRNLRESGHLIRMKTMANRQCGDEQVKEANQEMNDRGGNNADAIAPALPNDAQAGPVISNAELKQMPNDTAPLNNCAKVPQLLSEKVKLAMAKERRAARTMSIVVGTFILCWLPFFLMYVILPFCKSCKPTNKVVQFITWLGYINSTLNPIIYTVFNNDFRVAFTRILTCKLFQK